MTAAVDAAVMSHEKTDWQKNHARDRSYFAQYCHAMSDRKSQLITICMLIGALAMIGLARRRARWQMAGAAATPQRTRSTILLPTDGRRSRMSRRRATTCG
jgi:hypothetical protein